MEPLLVPPSNFAMVNDGLYRGSYPEAINMPFLESLHLKCIVSLIPEREPQEIVQFCKEHGIQHIHIDTDEYDIDCIPSKEEKKRVISLLIDGKNYPLYFYGNKNSKIVSVYVMMIRFVQKYHPSYIFWEFKKFGDKLDDDLKGIFDDLRILLPDIYPSWLPKDSINPQVLLSESFV